MPDVSVLIPAKNEVYLGRTIQNVLANARGDIEIIAVCDGYWPEPEIPDDPRIVLLHYTESIGQRPAVNQAARIARGKYIFKLDGHCAVDEGFDVKLAADCEYDWIAVPRMYQIDADKWTPKQTKKTDFMFFRSPEAAEHPFRIDYYDAKCARAFPEEYRAYRKAPWRQGDICDTMTCIGAGWFMHKDRFWELGGMDEAHGHWGQMGVELSCKAWLSGGRMIVNKKTWFAHMWRNHAPWKLTQHQVDKAREHSKALWLSGTWPLQKRPLSWLIEKFAPVPSWTGYQFKDATPKTKGEQEMDTNLVYQCRICGKWNRPDELVGDDRHCPSCDAEFAEQEEQRWYDLTLLYYTANRINEQFCEKVLAQLQYACPEAALVIVSQKPFQHVLDRIIDEDRRYFHIPVGEIGASLQNIYKQVLAGLREVKTEYVALVEDDCLYVPEHFTYRPQGKIAYNLNRWLLHADSEPHVFSYRRRPILSQCIAPTKLLLECLQQREGMDVPKKYSGEPGLFEGKLGLKEYPYETFETKEPNVVVCHNKNTSGRKYQGKDAEPRTDLAPWGGAGQLLSVLGLADSSPSTEAQSPTKPDDSPSNTEEEPDMAKFGRGSWKRWQHSYIGSIIFGMDEIMGQLMDFADRRRPGRAERRMKTLPPFVEKIAEGNLNSPFEDQQLRDDPWFAYLCELYPTWSRSHRERRVLEIMRETIALYTDIKDNGLKSPLDMWREGKDRLVLHRGWRRLIIMHELHKRGLRDFSRVPVRVFKSKAIFQKYAPSPAWSSGIPQEEWHEDKTISIHELATKQFMEKGVYATDKYWVHGYTRQYDRHFAHLRDKPVKLLEIGVFRGASLLLWKDVFPKGQIFGLDKNTAIWQKFLKGQDRIKVFVGKQEDEAFLKAQVIPAGPFDIIVDDGGHSPAEQIVSFNALWPHLAPGGIYVLEDLHRNTLARQAKEGPLMIDKVKAMVGDTIETNDCLELQSVSCYYNLAFLEKNK